MDIYKYTHGHFMDKDRIRSTWCISGRGTHSTTLDINNVDGTFNSEIIYTATSDHIAMDIYE